MRPTLPNFLAIVFVAAIALSLASCGRRGPLEPPPYAPLTGAPGDYEAATPGELAGQNTTAAPPRAAKTPPPHASKPFFLDPLL